jgi:4-amino-4-deoxy-L-arabinose transferase-like glycosyltransferase
MGGKRMSGRNLWLAMAGLLLLSLALRLPGYAEQPVMPDEVGFFQSFAWTIIEEGWVWPVKYMYIHPPLYPYTLAILTVLAGGSLGVLRLSTVAFGALTPVLVFLLAQELYDKRAAALAALLMAFSSYHILYSRALMLEVPVIFFLTLGLYLYARGLRKVSRVHTICAGVAFGLAVITKWIAILYVPCLLLFLLVSRRSFRGLLDRRTFAIFAVSGLVALPCVIDLSIHGVNPVYRNLGIGQPTVVDIVGIEVLELSDLAVRGLENFLTMSIDSDGKAAQLIPWQPAFLMIAGVVFVLAMGHAIYGFLRGRRAEALLFSTFILFNVFVAYYGKRFQYYLLWSLPFYLTLVAGSLTTMVRRAGGADLGARAARGLALAAALLFTASILSNGMLAPLARGGPGYGLDEQVAAVGPNLEPGDSIATTFPEIVLHYLEDYDTGAFEKRVLVLPLNRHTLSPIGFVEELDLGVISSFEPKFILTNRYYYDALAGSEEVRVIGGGYRLVSEVGEVILFERSPRDAGLAST